MVMAMRMVASGLVEGPLLISITKLLHAVELPILLVAIFKYNSLNFDKRLSSTLYLVGFACTSSIIASVLSPLAGYSYEKYGFAQSYLIMGLLVFLHHLYFHLLVALRQILRRSAGVATYRYLNQKSENDDLHNLPG